MFENSNFKTFFYFIVIALIIFICLKIYTESDVFNLKCIIAGKDGLKYCVRDREKIKPAANLLAETVEKCKVLVELMHEKYPNDKRIIKLHKDFDPRKISETLPTSDLTAFTENKNKMAFCLNKTKMDNDELIDDHTLMFVAIHELSHIMTTSIGHHQEFWINFKFLLQGAKELGIHDPINYEDTPQEYCGMEITNSPYYNL